MANEYLRQLLLTAPNETEIDLANQQFTTTQSQATTSSARSPGATRHGLSPAFTLMSPASFSGANVAYPEFLVLQKFTLLKRLSLASTGLASLAGFPTLQNLTSLSSIEVFRTVRLAKLKHLDLSNNQFADFESLEVLQSLPFLATLKLHGCPITHSDNYKEMVFMMINTLALLDNQDADGNENFGDDQSDDDRADASDLDSETSDDYRPTTGMKGGKGKYSGRGKSASKGMLRAGRGKGKGKKPLKSSKSEYSQDEDDSQYSDDYDKYDQEEDEEDVQDLYPDSDVQEFTPANKSTKHPQKGLSQEHSTGQQNDDSDDYDDEDDEEAEFEDEQEQSEHGDPDDDNEEDDQDEDEVDTTIAEPNLSLYAHAHSEPQSQQWGRDEDVEYSEHPYATNQFGQSNDQLNYMFAASPTLESGSQKRKRNFGEDDEENHEE